MYINSSGCAVFCRSLHTLCPIGAFFLAFFCDLGEYMKSKCVAFISQQGSLREKAWLSVFFSQFSLKSTVCRVEFSSGFGLLIKHLLREIPGNKDIFYPNNYKTRVMTIKKTRNQHTDSVCGDEK